MFRTETDWKKNLMPIAVGFREKTDGDDYRVLQMSGEKAFDYSTHMICRDKIPLIVGKTYFLKPLGEAKHVNLMIYCDKSEEATITMTPHKGVRLMFSGKFIKEKIPY